LKQTTLNGKRLQKRKGNDKIEIWIDGSCAPINPGGTGSIGYVMKENGQIIARGSKVVGKGKEMTTNVAEYLALINALSDVKALGLENANIFVMSDSQLIVNQTTGRCSVRTSSLKPYYREALNLVLSLDAKLEWISREENEEADELARQAYERSLKSSK
jgi:ribonuclease HI